MHIHSAVLAVAQSLFVTCWYCIEMAEWTELVFGTKVPSVNPALHYKALQVSPKVKSSCALSQTPNILFWLHHTRYSDVKLMALSASSPSFTTHCIPQSFSDGEASC